jgi:serine/threonine-protein phosphatase 6 regulatory ankyrin repeat subunit B
MQTALVSSIRMRKRVNCEKESLEGSKATRETTSPTQASNPKAGNKALGRRMKAEVSLQPNIQQLQGSPTASKAKNESLNPQLAETLVKYGNNSMGIPAIHFAVVQGDIAAVEQLLDFGASPNSKASNTLATSHFPPEPNSVLEYAARYGRLDIVNLLIARGAELQRREKLSSDQEYEVSPLVFAAAYNHENIIKALAAKGAKLNLQLCQNSSSLNPIFAAVNGNALNALRSLLDLGANLHDQLLIHCWDLLSLAAKKSNIEIARLLLKNKIDVDHPQFGSSALAKAVELRNVELIKMFLAHRAKIHRPQFGHSDPWFTAIKTDNAEIVDIFIKAGANIHTVDLWKSEGIFVAVKEKKLNAIKALLKAGVDVNIREFGQPLLSYAVSSQEIFQFLVERGADVHATFGGGITILHYAAGLGTPEVIRFLVKAGIPINKTNSIGNSPLHEARQNEKNFLVLLEGGANINLIGHQNWKPWQLMANNHSQISVDMLKTFVKYGANLNDQFPAGHGSCLAVAVEYEMIGVIEFLGKDIRVDINQAIAQRNGSTAFILATTNGRLEVMKSLLKMGAKINAVNSCKQTALSIARERHQELVNWLIANGAR